MELVPGPNSGISYCYRARNCFFTSRSVKAFDLSLILLIHNQKKELIDMKMCINTAERYKWGDNYDCWLLHKCSELSVWHKVLPPRRAEARHFHNYSQQFFYILSGSAVLKIPGKSIELKPQEGYSVPPLVPHQLCNETDSSLDYLVTSQPDFKGDIVFVEGKVSS